MKDLNRFIQLQPKCFQTIPETENEEVEFPAVGLPYGKGI